MLITSRPHTIGTFKSAIPTGRTMAFEQGRASGAQTGGRRKTGRTETRRLPDLDMDMIDLGSGCGEERHPDEGRVL
jgi:hypothetical protein